MNLQIFLKLLTALSVVTEKDPNGVSVSAYALGLKQALEIIAKNPADAQELNKIVMECVAGDWATFDSVGQFVAACLTQGKAAQIPQAMYQFNQMASKVATA